jgi:hypothetical protein
MLHIGWPPERSALQAVLKDRSNASMTGNKREVQKEEVHVTSGNGMGDTKQG